MADKEPKEASKPTWEQIVEAANDPAMVQALAGKHGMKVVNESEEALVKEVSKPKDIVLDVDGDVTESIQKAFRSLRDDLISYVDGKVDQGVGSVKKEVSATAEQARKQEIDSFIEKAQKEVGEETYRSIFQDFNVFYQGSGNLDKSWSKAKAANGINKIDDGDGEKEVGNTPSKRDAKPTVSALSSSDEDPEKENSKPVPLPKVRDAAEKHLKKIIAKEGDAWMG